MVVYRSNFNRIIPAHTFQINLNACRLDPKFNQEHRFHWVVPELLFPIVVPWASIRDVIFQWRQLDPQWDGEDTPLPAPHAIDVLDVFAQVAAARRLPEPVPYYAADAELGLRWSTVGRRASLSVLPDGNIIAFCQRADGPALRIRSRDEWLGNAEEFIAAIGKNFT